MCSILLLPSEIPLSEATQPKQIGISGILVARSINSRTPYAFEADQQRQIGKFMNLIRILRKSAYYS